MSQPWLNDTPHDEAVMSVLLSIRAFSDAVDRMNGSMKSELEMNSTDLAALRMLVVRDQRGESVSPHDLADHLRISTASTTKMLDRLSASGHVQRLPHPHDRRARVVALTEQSRVEFHRHFERRLQAMRDVATGFREEELRAVTRFLDDMGAAIDSR